MLQKLTDASEDEEVSEMVKMLNCTTFDIMSDLTCAEPLYMLENPEYGPWVKAVFLGLKRNTVFRCIRVYSENTRKAIDGLLPQLPALRKSMLQHYAHTTDRVDRRLAKTPDRPDL